MIRWASVVLGLSLFASTASAVEGMAWKWEESRRYLLIADVNAPEFLWFQAELNHQHACSIGVRISSWTTAEPAGKGALCFVQD